MYSCPLFPPLLDYTHILAEGVLDFIPVRRDFAGLGFGQDCGLGFDLFVFVGYPPPLWSGLVGNAMEIVFSSVRWLEQMETVFSTRESGQVVRVRFFRGSRTAFIFAHISAASLFEVISFFACAVSVLVVRSKQ